MESNTKSRALRNGRKIWSSHEDRALGEIIQRQGRKGWKAIAQQLNTATGGNKTAKQCRERFRNYLDPTLEKGEWTQTERTLFVILHKHYGNQWTLLSNFLSKRSDIAIKNHYYSIVRKSLRLMAQELIPVSILDKPGKLFCLMYILEVIRTKYLSTIENGKKAPLDAMEKIVVKLIKEREATVENISLYEEKILKKFLERNSSAKLPLILKLNLHELDISQELRIQLTRVDASATASRLTGLIQASLSLSETVPSEPEKITAHSEKADIPENKRDVTVVSSPLTLAGTPQIDQLFNPGSLLFPPSGMNARRLDSMQYSILQQNLLLEILQRERILATIFPEATSLNSTPSLITALRQQLASALLTQTAQLPNNNPAVFSSLDGLHHHPSSNFK